MFKNAVIYRIAPGWNAPTLEALREGMDALRFKECQPTERSSAGWVAPRNEPNAPLVEEIGGQWILKLMTESKMLPGSVLRDKLDEACKKLEQESGRKPGAKAKRAMKEEIELTLLPQAFTRKGATTMWINHQEGYIVIDAGSTGKTDLIITKLVEALTLMNACPNIGFIKTKTSPSRAMATWLIDHEAPFQFGIGRECELKSSDAQSAAVRYNRHSLDMQEVVDHIVRMEKQPIKLAMIYKDRLDFVLTDDLVIKKITLDDVVNESREDVGVFDADVAIITGELRQLIPAVIEALGGEVFEQLGETGAQEGAAPAEKPQLDAPSQDGPVEALAASIASDAGGAPEPTESGPAPWDHAVGVGSDLAHA